MTQAPSVIVFDVNETLSDLGPLSDRFVTVGAPAGLASLWFTTVLRDGVALSAAGASPVFTEVGADALRTLLHGTDLCDPADGGVVSSNDAIEYILGGLGRLPLHPDVVDGARGLRADGYRLVTLSNGSTQVTEQLLEAAELRHEFEAVLSVEDVGPWKPVPAAYAHAVRVCDVEPSEVLLAAVHPWDVDGATRAGLRAAWINRAGTPYPASFTPAWIQAAGLVDLRRHLSNR